MNDPYKNESVSSDAGDGLIDAAEYDQMQPRLMDIYEDPASIRYLNDQYSAGVIMADEWGNEWDESGEFTDMDFRLVDE